MNIQTIAPIQNMPHRAGLHFSTHRQCVQGFTLIELIVTIAVLGILIAIAIPSFQAMLQANRLQSASAEFQSALALARTEAIKHGGDAKVTVLANLVDGTRSWDNGYTVFVNRSNANDLPGLDAESAAAAEVARSERLSNVAALDSQIDVTDSGNLGGTQYATYNGMGRSIALNGSFLATRFQFSSATGAVAANTHCIYMNALGRTRSFKPAAPNTPCPTNVN